MADRFSHPVQLPEVDGFQAKSRQPVFSANLSFLRTAGGRLPDLLQHACSTSARNWTTTQDNAARQSQPGFSPGLQLWLAVRIPRRITAPYIQLLKLYKG
jgi:hypothetical protein